MNKVYDIVTQEIENALNAGIVPWRQPWRAGGHRNLRSRRPYRGVNTLLLELARMSKGYGSEWWLSYKQAQDLGGQVRAGEKATLVVFWKPTHYRAKDTDPETGDEVEVERDGLILRYYHVFNAEQCDGIEPPREPVAAAGTVDAAERILAAYPNPPTIRHGGDRAYYVAPWDRVQVPPRERFESLDRYYGTLFHELTHSTGHEKRLDRPIINHFGSDQYSREELVAEIGSAMLLAEAGLTPDYPQVAGYVGGWLKALRDDRRLVVIAAGQAQRAVDHIRNRAPPTAPAVTSVVAEAPGLSSP